MWPSGRLLPRPTRQPSSTSGDLLLPACSSGGFDGLVMLELSCMEFCMSNVSCCGCRNNREAMDKIVEDLLISETIRGEDFRSTLSKYSKIPEGAPT